MDKTYFWVFLAAFVLGICVTGIVKMYALRANLLDVPNQRSSHDLATPRGGGLSFVLVFLSVVLVLLTLGDLDRNTAAAFLVGGGLVAGVGFVDDHRHVEPKWRFLIQVIATTFAILMLGGLPEVQFADCLVDLGLLGHAAAVIFVVWLINLYNFMDGIDGIAAIEAICIAGSALVIPTVDNSGFFASLLVVFIAAVSGFLVWNWPPAKIFMGDIGSGFIGFVVALFAIISSQLGILPIWCWLILAAVFVVDSTVTLVTRAINGEAWYLAHNNHAYQKVTRLMKGHRPVTLAVLTINLLWLLPLAWFASARPDFGWWLTIVAWTPLVALSLSLKAGRPDTQN